MSVASAKRTERDEYIAKLRDAVKPGDTLYTVLRHRSASGMSRAIDVYHFAADPEQPDRPVKMWLSYWTAKALDMPFSERYDAITVGGTGMDMGFHVVYNLSYTLFPDGFDCTGERCPSNDHSNGDRDRTPHHHNDGGYALRHEWI